MKYKQMSDKQYMSWYLSLCNQEFRGDTNELDSQIMLVEDNQVYM